MSFHRLVVTALSLAACTGQIEGPAPQPPSTQVGEAPPASGTAGPPGAAPVPAVTPPVANMGGAGAGVGVGPSPLLRLSVVEYVNTVGDLLGLSEGDRATLRGDLPGDPIADTGFASPGLMGADTVERFGEAARRAAAKARLPDLAACKADEACLRAFLEGFGSRAFRRPIERAEVDDLLALHAALGKAGLPAPAAATEMVAALLQSPQFLYHGGPGGSDRGVESGGVVRLTAHQLAARLSYALWRTLPDEPLRVAVAEGRLATAADVARESRRLLADPRAKTTAADLYEQILLFGDVVDVAKNVDATSFDPALRGKLRDEARAFVSDSFAGGGDLRTLLSSRHAKLDGQLAAHYRQPGITGDVQRSVTLPSDVRAGLLSLGALMAVHATAQEASPIKRGAFVRQRVLCQHLPAPPADIPQLPPSKAGGTFRERLERHRSDPACLGCHQLIDPIGYAFTGFDEVGRPRALEEGKPVDTHGAIMGLDGKTHEVTGLDDLAQALAGSADVRACAVRQWFRFLLGRAEVPAESATLDGIERAFASGGGKLAPLVEAIVSSPSFVSMPKSMSMSMPGGAP